MRYTGVMSISDLVGLIFYIAQNFGVALGVGGATVSLTLAARNRPYNAEASSIAGGIERAGLWFIVVSGIFITLAHAIAGEMALVTAPAYVFKWVVILFIFLFNITASVTRTKDEPHAPITGIVTATWYALFILHTTVPSLSFGQLFMGYILWVIVFFAGFIFFTKQGDVLKPPTTPSTPQAN